MVDSVSYDVILDFLRRNKFARAEAALCSELSMHPDTNGFLQKRTLEEDSGTSVIEQNGDKLAIQNSAWDSHQDRGETLSELIVKEIERRPSINIRESKWKNTAFAAEHTKLCETQSKILTNPNGSEDTVFDQYSWKSNQSNGPGGLDRFSYGFPEVKVLEHPRYFTDKIRDSGVSCVSEEEFVFSGGKRSSIAGSSKACIEPKNDKTANYDEEESYADPWSRTEVPMTSPSDSWKDFSAKTVLPSSKAHVFNSFESIAESKKRETKMKTDIRTVMKEHVDEVGRTLYLTTMHGLNDQNYTIGMGFPTLAENLKEEFPRLAPVKIKSEEKTMTNNWEEKYDQDRLFEEFSSAADNMFHLGSYLDVPAGQEINSSGIVNMH